MLLREEDQIAHKLACPCCKRLLERQPLTLLCSNGECRLHGTLFDKVNGVNVLVDFTKSVLDRRSLFSRAGESVVTRPAGWRGAFWKFGLRPNRVAPKIAADLLDRLRQVGIAESRRPLVAIVGGGTVDNGARLLLDAPDIDVIALDVYESQNVSLIADGHDIPLLDESVDAVWIQAVLEHVVDAGRVVEEIHRVLKFGGLVYADSPFLWPVHEQAYDFVRWTASGHRWLFREFEVLAAGTSSGPGTAAYLALKGLAVGMLRSATLGHLATLPLCWLHWLDDLTAPRYRVNVAGGSFLFGRKASTSVDVHALIRYYDQQVDLEKLSRRTG